LELGSEANSFKGTFLENFPEAWFLKKMGTWILLMTNFVPISLLMTVEMVKFFQAIFIEWDYEMTCMNSGNTAIV
jgi:phospholipid-transporting ATPase